MVTGQLAGQIAVWTYRGLVNSRTGQVADWTTELAVSHAAKRTKSKHAVAGGIRELSSNPRDNDVTHDVSGCVHGGHVRSYFVFNFNFNDVDLRAPKS